MKDNNDVSRVNLRYVANRTEIILLSCEMYLGSIIDNTQCPYMIVCTKKYGYKNAGLILKREYFNIKNINYFDIKGYDFLLMIKNSTTFGINKMGRMLLIMTEARYYLLEHDVYGFIKTGTIGRRMVL